MSFKASEKSWEKALEFFDRTKKSFDKDVETMRNWIKTQQHFPEIMDERMIRNFLIINKCSIERTKEKIDNYYTLPSLIPDFYNVRNPKHPNMMESLQTMYYFTFPQMVEDKYRIIFGKVREQKEKLYPAEIFMHFINIFEMRLMEDCMVGDIYIFDWGMVTFGNVIAYATPTLLAKMFSIMENVCSLRIKEVYFINAPPYITNFISVLKKIMKPKIFSRIHVYEDAEILKTILSDDNLLPKDYGGNGPTLEEYDEAMRSKLEEYQARFDELDKLRVDESLRPEKLKNDEFLGFHGNFKKLDVD